jgi:hypothetical protein
MDDGEALSRLARVNRLRRLRQRAGVYRRSTALALLSLAVAVLAWTTVGIALWAERGSGVLLAGLVTGLVLLYMALEIGADSRIAGVNARIDALVALLEEDERAASPETPATASGSAGTRGTGPPGPAA